MAMKGITRIPVHRNPHYKPDGKKSFVYLLHKYGINPTKEGPYQRNENRVLIKRQADGSSGEVTSDDQQNDSFYTCPVEIGTPAQTLNLDFDSGSADLWVWSTHLSKKLVQTANSSGVKVFDSTKSSTFHNSGGSSWKITYGDNSAASGTVGTDNVKIGDITVKGQAIELASQISSQLQQQTESQGLLGLAFGTINTVKPSPVKTPLENMIAQQDISASQELFTCYLGSYKDANDPDKGQSFYTFGSIYEPAIPSGQQIAYTPVDNSDGFWKFDSPSMTVNGKTVRLSGNTAIADTGTTLMMVSSQVCQQVYGAIPGAQYDNSQQGWLYPASTTNDQLPTLTFAVGDTSITIDKEHIAFQAIDGTDMIYGGIQDRGDLDFDIFGDVFLQNVYAVFDAGKLQFGVVQRADPTPDGSGSGQ